MVLVKAPLEGAQLERNPKPDLMVLVIAPENGTQQHPIKPQKALPKASMGLHKTSSDFRGLQSDNNIKAAGQ